MITKNHMKLAGLLLTLSLLGTYCMNDAMSDSMNETGSTKTFTVKVENTRLDSGTMTGTNAGLSTTVSLTGVTNTAAAFHFATMLAQTNDWFIAPASASGIALFDNSGNPISGDVTVQLSVWDAGTETDETYGAGANQAPRQAGPNTGAADANTAVRQVTNINGATVDQLATLIITPGATLGDFTLTLTNISGATAAATPFAPGAWVVSISDSPIFTAGSSDTGSGLEALAEDGNNANLAEALLVTPLAPGIWVVHNNSDILFTANTGDAGLGLEALAEDGDPSTLSAALAGNANISQSGIFNTPDGAGAAAVIQPGESYSFSFTASSGDRLSFATMLVQSNDLFYAPPGNGLALFNGTAAISGDITSQATLWDAGTEVNQTPGAGADQAPRQAAPNTGAAEMGVVQPVSGSGDGFFYATAPQSIRVTITSM